MNGELRLKIAAIIAEAGVAANDFHGITAYADKILALIPQPVVTAEDLIKIMANSDYKNIDGADYVIDWSLETLTYAELADKLTARLQGGE